jgi:hypothetical protein
MEEPRIWTGSAVRLKKELATIAPAFGIPLVGDELADETALKINDFAPLFDGDKCDLAEDERTAWLLMYEGARLASGHHVALSLAG